MTSNGIKAVLLIRVSDLRQEKEGLSLDNQEQVLRRYAEELGFEIVKEFRFHETADLKIRRRFHEMVNLVKSKDGIRAIVGYRVDRMTRNFHDHVLLDDLRLNYRKELHFVHDHLVITHSTVGRDIQEWDTKVYLAKMYLNRLKEEAVISGAFKVSRGEWPGKAPFGYLNTKKDLRSWIEPDPVNSKVVMYCFETYATGAFSMEQVRAKVSATFGLKLSNGKIDFILKNRFYYGEMLYKGERHPHIYEPIISLTLFERVMAVKESFHKTSYKFAGLPYLYRGLIHCAECGCLITPETTKKSDGRSYTYYHCTQYHGKHGAAWVREEELTKQFAKIFHGLKIPDDRLGRILTMLGDSHDSKVKIATETRSRLSTERERYSRRLEVLYEDRLDDLITKDVYAVKRKEYEQAIRDIDRRFKDLADADEEYYLTASTILELCSKSSVVFDRGDVPDIRRLLKLVLQNCRLRDKTLVWDLKSPFDMVFSRVVSKEWLPLANMFQDKKIVLDVQLEEVQNALALLSFAPPAA